VIELVRVSLESDRERCLAQMGRALTLLCHIAYLQVPLNESAFTDNSYYLYSEVEPGDSFSPYKIAGSSPTASPSPSSLSAPLEVSDKRLLPKLVGRATVNMTFYRPGKGRTKEVTIIVDGLNYPITSGNFIELCEKNFYEGLPVSFQQIDYDNSQIANFTVLGSFANQNEKGFVDPLTGRQRRIPLEVYREDENRNRFTVVGGAKNSAVFTRAKPVQSFITV
jgi:hypothetical protein